MPEYKPGVCNIGKNEIRKRYALAVVAFVLSAIVSYATISLNLPKFALILTFIFLIIGFEGFYQGYFKFCTGFAAAGLSDFTGSRSKVTNSESHKKDMKKAMNIHLCSIISSIIVVTFIYFIL